MTNVEIVKPPLYGSVYWNGSDFIYTPNNNFSGSDYYVYSAFINGAKQIKTNYVNTENVAPLILNPSLTATIKNVNIIPINLLVSDSTTPFDYLDLIYVSDASNGKAYIKNNSIYYESTIFNFVENLTYQISDRQYISTGTLTLSVIDGINQVEIPLTIKQILDILLAKSKTIESLSGHWMVMYSVLTSFSAFWNSYVDKYIPFSSLIESISSDWVSLSSIKDNADSLVSVMSTNSANWDSNYIDGTFTYDLINPKAEQYNYFYNFLYSNSGLWNSSTQLSSEYINFKTIIEDVISTVSANSATLWDTTELNSLSGLYFDNWITMYNHLISRHPYYDASLYYQNILSSGTSQVSANYDDMVNTISANSATTWEIIPEQYFYDLNSGYSLLTSNSSNWDLVNEFNSNLNKYDESYNTLQENITSKWIPETFNKILTADSNNWNSTYDILTSLSANWDFDDNRDSLVFYTNLTSNSSNWDNSFTEIQSNSANSDLVRSNVISLSTKYLTGSFDTDLTVNNLNVNDSLTSRGSVTILGDVKQFDTAIVTTSAFIIYNESTNNALDVNKIGGLKIATFKNPTSASVLYVNSTNSVGINMPYDATEALTVSGNISASGNIYPYLSDSINLYKTVSASYENTYSVLNANSATTIANFLASKPNYDNLVNYVNLSSSTINNLLTGSYGIYNTLYNVTTSQSTINNTNYTFLTSNSSNIGKDQHFRDNKFIYDGLYNIYLNSNN